MGTSERALFISRSRKRLLPGRSSRMQAAATQRRPQQQRRAPQRALLTHARRPGCLHQCALPDRRMPPFAIPGHARLCLHTVAAAKPSAVCAPAPAVGGCHGLDCAAARANCRPWPCDCLCGNTFLHQHILQTAACTQQEHLGSCPTLAPIVQHVRLRDV